VRDGERDGEVDGEGDGERDTVGETARETQWKRHSARDGERDGERDTVRETVRETHTCRHGVGRGRRCSAWSSAPSLWSHGASTSHCLLHAGSACRQSRAEMIPSLMECRCRLSSLPHDAMGYEHLASSNPGYQSTAGRIVTD
jgi:hypothetical protein